MLPPVPLDLSAQKNLARKAMRSSRPAHHLHVVTFEHDQKSCSQLLFDILQTVPEAGMSVRNLIHSLGERGLLMVCMVFCIPSLIPLPIPGMSIPQGFLITLLGLGVFLNRTPLLPDRLLDYRIGSKNLRLILEKGTRLFARIEKLSYPRLDPLTASPPMRVINGLLLVAGALMLMAPFPIPFSNVLPAYGIVFLAFGDMQRDGWLVLAGYLMLVLTLLYVSAVFFFGATWIYALFR